MLMFAHGTKDAGVLRGGGYELFKGGHSGDTSHLYIYTRQRSPGTTPANKMR